MAENAANWISFLEQVALSDIGLRRSNNQDSYAVVLANDERHWEERGHLMMVADGMGAHAAGELASKLACGGIPHIYQKLRDRPAPEALRQAVVETNAHIHERGEANAEFHGMGTTCSVLAILPQGAVVAHVGDSRVYRLRSGVLEQLTFDHSLVWEMMAAGRVPQEEVPCFIPKNIITRSLGPHAEVLVDMEGPFPLEPGDTFLMCSDGLTGQIKDEEIGSLLSALCPADAARALVDMANLRGGPDNITVIIARVGPEVVELCRDPESFCVAAPSVASFSAVHPALWIVGGISLLSAAGMAAVGSRMAAIFSGLGALIAIGAAIWQAFAQDPQESPAACEGPFGAAPYSTLSCTPTSQSIESLAELAHKLQEAAAGENWSIDWERYKDFDQRASLAIAQNDFTSALREYALAVTFMVSQIRAQRALGSRAATE